MNSSETFTNDEVFLTSSTRLATALLSLGETLRRPPCTRQVRRDGKTIVTFLFEPGQCGKHAAAWTALEQQDPGSDTPESLTARLKWLREIVTGGDLVATAYANAAWRDLTLMIVKATPRMVEIYGKDSIGFVREDATPADLRNIQRHL
jgi:hypothetical protein